MFRAPSFDLRKQLRHSLLLVGVGSTVFTGLVFLARDLWEYHDSVLQGMESEAQRVAARWSEAGVWWNPTSDLSWRKEAASNPWIGAVALFDAEGEPLTSFNRHKAAEDDPQLVQEAASSFVKREVSFRGTHLGTVIVYGNPGLMWVRVIDGLMILLAASGVAALAASALTRRAHGRVGRRLLDLAHVANVISVQKDYSIRALGRSDDEIGILVDTFNHMVTRIELANLRLKSEIERAEAASEAKAQFLATMSHEIRTPINGILGMAELLAREDLEDEQADFVKMISTSAESLLRVINDILDFSKGEAGRFEIEHTSFEIHEVVDNCVDSVSIIACEKSLELYCHVDERTPASLVGDPVRIQQVLLNLLSNALKFTPPRGEVALRAVVEEAVDDRVKMRFEVADTGIGVPADRVDRLFKSFSQVDASNNRKYGGTGLGLAIGKQIVEAMGGEVFVKTQEGAGSTFGFTVDLETETSATVATTQESPQGLHILIADPHRTNRDLLAGMLEDGNTLELAESAKEMRGVLGDRDAEARSFDLMLVDARFAEGLSAAESTAAASTPVIVMVKVDRMAEPSLHDRPGRTTVLRKPVKARELAWCIQEALEAGEPAPALPAPRRPHRAEEPLDALRVLVAEDNVVNQRITSRFLETLDVDYTMVDNGKKAVEAVRDGHFDLVLLDIQMPVMDGFAAMQSIRKLELVRSDRVPIVAMTANVLPEHRRNALTAGFDGYLAKPFKLAELEECIRTWSEDRAEAA